MQGSGFLKEQANFDCLQIIWAPWPGDMGLSAVNDVGNICKKISSLIKSPSFFLHHVDSFCTGQPFATIKSSIGPIRCKKKEMILDIMFS